MVCRVYYPLNVNGFQPTRPHQGVESAKGNFAAAPFASMLRAVPAVRRTGPVDRHQPAEGDREMQAILASL